MARTRLRDLRRQPPDQADFRSPVHDPRVVARVGVLLAAAIGTAFVTGMLSHLHQHPVAWLPFSPVPAWGYRVSQGLHVAAGLAALPLLLAKLYAAYPALFQRPRLRGPLHALERGSVAVLVATAIFQLVTGLLNTFQWYPWSFSFVRVHLAVAWVLVGSIVIHVAVKLPVIAASLRRPVGEDAAGEHGGPTRRGFLAGVATTVLGLTALTVGQTVAPLSGAALLSPRQSGVGVQGVPVNRTGRAAGVLDRATDPAWRLTVRGPGGTVQFSRTDLEAMPQVTVVLPIACVEGWSTTATWQGVRVVDLVGAVGGRDGADVRVVSLQETGSYNESVLPGAYARHPDSVVALRLGGEPLHVDHGYPRPVHRAEPAGGPADQVARPDRGAGGMTEGWSRRAPRPAGCRGRAGRCRRRGGADVRAAAPVAAVLLWLAGGVAVHDAVLAPAAVVLGALVLPRVPVGWRPALRAGTLAAAVLGIVAVVIVAASRIRRDPSVVPVPQTTPSSSPRRSWPSPCSSAQPSARGGAVRGTVPADPDLLPREDVA